MVFLERTSISGPNNISDMASGLSLLDYTPPKTATIPTVLLFSSRDDLVPKAEAEADRLYDCYGYDFFTVSIGSKLNFGSIPSQPEYQFLLDGSFAPGNFVEVANQITKAMAYCPPSVSTRRARDPEHCN
ncbi:unnamed protein product, partial [Mesorhabditis spiculigera]